RMLGLSGQCIHNWFRQWQGDDPAFAHERRGGSGRKPKLDGQHWGPVDEALRRGPRSYGFPSDRWTLDRVCAVIHQVTGVRYHPSSVWRILRTMGWKLRLPPRSERPDKGYVPRQWTAPAPRIAESV